MENKIQPFDTVWQAGKPGQQLPMIRYTNGRMQQFWISKATGEGEWRYLSDVVAMRDEARRNWNDEIKSLKYWNEFNDKYK